VPAGARRPGAYGLLDRCDPRGDRAQLYRPNHPRTLFAPSDETVRFGSKGMRLPEGGGRLTLQTARGPVALDLWEGNEEGFTDDESRTLAIATSILGLGMR